MLKENFKKRACDILIAVATFVSLNALNSDSSILFGEAELPLDVKEKK